MTAPRQSAITRAVKAVAAVAPVSRVEIAPDGRIVVYTRSGEARDMTPLERRRQRKADEGQA